jgi:hypothetical protein
MGARESAVQRRRARRPEARATAGWTSAAPCAGGARAAWRAAGTPLVAGPSPAADGGRRSRVATTPHHHRCAPARRAHPEQRRDGRLGDRQPAQHQAVQAQHEQRAVRAAQQRGRKQRVQRAQRNQRAPHVGRARELGRQVAAVADHDAAHARDDQVGGAHGARQHFAAQGVGHLTQRTGESVCAGGVSRPACGGGSSAGVSSRSLAVVQGTWSATGGGRVACGSRR